VEGYADPLGGVYRRTVVRLDPDGTPRWTFQDDAAHSSGVLALGDAVYVGGYKLSEDDLFRPLVTRVGNDGQLEWTTVLRHGELKGYIVGLFLTSRGRLLVVVDAYEGRLGAPDERRRLMIVELALDGREVRREVIQLSEGTGPLTAWTSATLVGGHLFYVTNRTDYRTESGVGRWEWDAYDQIRSCGWIKTASIHVIDVGSLTVTARAEHEGMEVRDIAQTSDGRVLVTGSQGGRTRAGDCLGEERLRVAEVAQDASLRPIYSDNEGYKSTGTGLFPGPKGTLIVLGQSTRMFAMKPRLGLSRFDLDELRKIDRAEMSDGIVLQLDGGGNLISRNIVSGGVSLSLRSGVAVGDRILAVGTFGYEWVLIELEAIRLEQSHHE
jgi:hypothetical protein